MTQTCCKQISNALFIPSLFVSITLYLVDIGSDIFLAFRYYKSNDVWWCGLTITFIAIPWLYVIFGAKQKTGCSVPLIFAIFNLLPVK